MEEADLGRLLGDLSIIPQTKATPKRFREREQFVESVGGHADGRSERLFKGVEQLLVAKGAVRQLGHILGSHLQI